MISPGTKRRSPGKCTTCFFCLGVSAMGMDAAEYRRVTYDITTCAAARSVVEANLLSMGGTTFVYVSGAGTADANGRAMWARVKGETENALLAMPFKAAYMFFGAGNDVRDAGIQSKTGWYWNAVRRDAENRCCSLLLDEVSEKYVTTTDQVGRAMLEGGRNSGYPRQVLESVDIASV